MRMRSSTMLAMPMFAGALLLPAIGSAHISLEQADTHMSRYGDGEIKDAPCGRAGGRRGTNVYRYKPGETITVSLVEFIPHPGYFRIAFDADGDDGFENPATTDGEFGSCAGDPKCGPGMTDYCNNATVLLDYLDPHSASFGAPPYTWSVTLPNVECDNCTLQIIQVMNDLNLHPQPYPADDIYYQCIDLVLSNSAEDVTDVPVDNDGMVCTSGEPQGGAGGNGGASGSAGASGTSGASGASGTSGASGMGGLSGVGGAAGAAGGASGVGGGSAGIGSAGTASSAVPPIAGAPAAGASGAISGPVGGAPPQGMSSTSSSCAVAPGGRTARGTWTGLLAVTAALVIRSVRRRSA